MKTYKTSDLFDLKVDGNFPLNCEFVAKTSIPSTLETAGIYMMFFDQQIIYIGIAEKEPFIERMKKQLSAITLRGKSVCFNDTCKAIIRSSHVLPKEFSTAVEQNNAGFETSKNRISFAEQNWDIFSTLNQDDLSRFVIVWFPKNECLDKPLEEMKSQWIKTLKPYCNK
jgi:hypothetical protein